MWRQSSDLITVILVAAAAVAVTLLGIDNGAARVAVALPLVLIAPGYALQAALFPTRELSGVERGLYSVGLSLAITILGGLMLNWSPWGLQAASWALLLGAAALLASAIAWLRRPRLLMPAERPRGPALSLRHGLLLVLAAALVAGAVAAVRAPVASQGLQGYTALWLVPAANGDRRSVRLGIGSQEFASTRYRLRLEMNRRVIRDWPAIELGTGERWEQQIELPADLPDGAVDAVLYRLDSPESVYRRVTLWRSTK